MKRDHSQVRYLSLLIIDELFMRSKLFRILVVENLDQLLSLSIGFRRNHPLPAPAAVASVLRTKAVEFLEKWHVSFGIHYRQLRLGYDYLKNTVGYQFPNLQANAAPVQQERRERELKTTEILLKKFESLETNFNLIKEEIHSTINAIGECLDIIKNKDEDMPLSPLIDEEMEEFRNPELLEIRLDSLKEGKRVKENSENTVVFDALRELYKVLVTGHFASLQEWISVLIRVEVADTRKRDSMLKEFIDIKNHLHSVMELCEEAGCAITKNTGLEEDFIWEEGDIETKSFKANESIRTHQQSDPITGSSFSEVRDAAPECSNKRSKARDQQSCEGSSRRSNPLRSKLLAEAPAVKWGSFLDYWGSKQDILANQRGLDLESHWGRVDSDAVLPAEKIAELNVQATFYTEEPVEIQPCRAPLRKGGLCQRRDRKVCPFHGPIFPRDDEGNRINQSSSAEQMVPSVSYGLTEEIARQAIKNVRERDKREADKRDNDRQAMKRAKLAKIRAHNESALKDAALASTSRSSFVGEQKETTNHAGSSTKKKKETLASMLKKKETTKDRLSRRLLNARTRDASTREVSMGEDAHYREAFLNQW